MNGQMFPLRREYYYRMIMENSKYNTRDKAFIPGELKYHKEGKLS